MKIFRLLNMNERYIASLVCWNWAQAFTLPDVWRVFVLDDTVLTKSKYNYYLGWQVGRAGRHGHGIEDGDGDKGLRAWVGFGQKWIIFRKPRLSFSPVTPLMFWKNTTTDSGSC